MYVYLIETNAVHSSAFPALFYLTLVLSAILIRSTTLWIAHVAHSYVSKSLLGRAGFHTSHYTAQQGYSHAHILSEVHVSYPHSNQVCLVIVTAKLIMQARRHRGFEEVRSDPHFDLQKIFIHRLTF